MNKISGFVICFVLVVFCAAGAGGQVSFDKVPGTVINYIESPAGLFGLEFFPVYVCDPSIVVLENGDYIASHARFGSGSGSKECGLTSVFRSRDKGNSWQETARLSGILRASLFVHRGDLYLLGTKFEGGPNVIRKSSDGGETWTKPEGPQSGMLGSGGLGTPNNPIEFEGRIWSAINRGVYSAEADANLLKADAWARCSRRVIKEQPFGNAWLGRWGEAQIVASAEHGIYVLPMIRGLQHTALLKVVGPRKIDFRGTDKDAFAIMPGADKKFGVGYDEKSDTFYALTNPILDVHAGHPEEPWMKRTAAAVLTSRDLIHWDVRKIFLFTHNIDNGWFGEGFQYFNFDIDGNDMVVVSRTAFDIGQGQRKPPRGHDSNMMTFHRIRDFRDVSCEHYLVVDTENNSVRRFESTQHEDAPLGGFALGQSFAGSGLLKPVGIGQSDDGDVYIRQRNGRILRFDAGGNFIETVETAPVAVENKRIDVRQPGAGQRIWKSSGSGSWLRPANWYYWNIPDTEEETAVFGTAAREPAKVRIAGGHRLKGMRFMNRHGYKIVGSGELEMHADKGKAFVEVVRGRHRVGVNVQLASDTECLVEDDAELDLGKCLELNGSSLCVRGGGKFVFGGEFMMSGGSLILEGPGPVVFGKSAKIKPDGVFVFGGSENFEPRAGAEYKLIEGVENLAEEFEKLDMPVLCEDMEWDVSRFYTEGIVRIAER